MGELKKIDMAQAFALNAAGDLHGLFEMSEEDYRGSPGLNQSLLKSMLKCPAAYKQALEWASVQTKRSKALELGQLIHTLVLEGQEVFDARVGELPADVDARTKVFKEAKKEIEDQGKIAITQSDIDAIYGVYKSQCNDPIASKVFSGGKAEVVAYGRHKSGTLLKGKLDYIKDKTVFDLKTTISCDDDNFGKSARKFNYDFQAAFYLDLANLAVGKDWFDTFAILAVEKTPPFLWNYFVVSPTDIQAAREKYEDAISQYLKCEKEKKWPGYEPRFKTINFGGYR